MTGWTTAAAGVCVTKRKYVERFSHSSASSPSFHWSPERHSKTAWCSPPRHRTLHHRVNTPLRAPPFTKSHRSPALARRYPADSRRLLPWCHRLGRINRESATNGSKRNIQEGGRKQSRPGERVRRRRRRTRWNRWPGRLVSWTDIQINGRRRHLLAARWRGRNRRELHHVATAMKK